MTSIFGYIDTDDLINSDFDQTEILFFPTFRDQVHYQVSEGYQLPDSTLVDLIDAPETPSVRFGPDRGVAVLLSGRSYPTIEELAEEELGLAGIRFLPRLHFPSRQRPMRGLELLDIGSGATRAVSGLPESPRILGLEWSPAGRHASFVHLGPTRAELWVVDIERAAARRIATPSLHLVARNWPKWIDARTLLATVIPGGQGAPPPEPKVPRGPVVRTNDGEKAGARTYQDLLANAHDEALFEHYLSAQLVTVSLDGKLSQLGEPAMLAAAEASPDGRYLLVETWHRPFSYLVPADRFPLRSEIWTTGGEPVTLVHHSPLQDAIPLTFGSVATGPRSITWRDDVPATLVWAEALDGGDSGAEAELRDRVMLLDAPFAGEPRQLAAIDLRFGGIDWGRGDLALLYGWWWKTRMQKTWLLQPDVEGAQPRTIEERSWQDRYSDPGNPTREADARGRWLLQTSADGRSIFRIGSGASPEGDRPFLDRVSLETGEATRLFRSEAPYYERPVRVLDGEGLEILTRRESKTEPPNYLVRNLEAGTSRALTAFAHPAPQLASIQKELITYSRADGVQLSATLFTPPEYDPAEDGPLPMLMWAYPNEFKNADAA
ncbi:MAG: hypothetical protein MI919_40985, partial [Holophagales bacterium]|nr:hypothetical protein [Holophagales bacterium]